MNHTPARQHDALESLAGQIAEIVQQARSHVRQSVNQAMVACYWEIGRLIVEHEQQGQARAAYGQRQLAELSGRLTAQFGRGFDQRNLRNMRLFFQCFPIRNAVRTELSWTHYRTLLRVENPAARDWYLREAINQNWSARALERQIGVLYYERLLTSKEKAVVEAEAREQTAPLAETAKDFLRDPYVLDFLNLNASQFLESDLEQAITDNLQSFLLELGRGFAFVARQQRVSFDDEDFYLDLVFYNFKLKCFLLVDLKLGKLTHQDMGQMDTYVRLYDEQIKGADATPPSASCCAAKRAKPWCAIRCWPSSSSYSPPNTCPICPARQNSSWNSNANASVPCYGWRSNRNKKHEQTEIDREIKQVRRSAATSPTLEEKLSRQKKQRELEGKRSKLRRELFARQDEVEAQRLDRSA